MSWLPSGRGNGSDCDNHDWDSSYACESLYQISIHLEMLESVIA